MSLPTLEKTWQLNINNVATPEANLPWHQKLLYSIKEAMIGFASNPWVVVGSCDDTNFDVIPTTSNDYWLTHLQLIWNTGAHSWIVLENVDGVQICFDLDWSEGNCEYIYLWYSAGGLFVGGDASNRPTATDEANFLLGTANIWFGGETVTPVYDYVWHMWHSADGTVTRMVAYYQDIPFVIWRFEKFQNPRAGHVIPYGVGVYSLTKTNDALTPTNQEDQDVMRSDHGGLNMAIFCMGVGRQGLNMMERDEEIVAEEIDGDMAFSEVGYLCNTWGGRGPKGKAFDMWWGQYRAVHDGDTYPNSPTAREFVQMGCFIFPWTGDATVPLIR